MPFLGPLLCWRGQTGSRGSLAVTPVEELVDQRLMGRLPTKLVPRLGRIGGLVKQQHFGEIVPKRRARASSSEPGTAPGAPTATAAASVSSATVDPSPLPIT